MSVVRTLLIVIPGILCVLAGCAQKPKQPLRTVPVTSSPAKKADSGDIFNEFYSNSAAAPDKAKKIKTFSVHPSKAPQADSPAAASASYTPSFSDNGRYVIQVSCVASRWLADELATEFKEKGYPSYVLEVQNPTPSLSGTYYRVRIGGFATRADADAFGENILKPANLGCWVDRKQNEASSPLESQLNQGASGYGTSTYTPAAQPAYTPPPPAAQPAYTPPPPAAQPAYTPPPPEPQPVITPGPGTIPAGDQTQGSRSTGGWSDSTAKW